MNFDDEITHFIENCKEADVPIVLQGVDVEGIMQKKELLELLIVHCFMQWDIQMKN